MNKIGNAYQPVESRTIRLEPRDVEKMPNGGEGMLTGCDAEEFLLVCQHDLMNVRITIKHNE